MGDSAAGRDRHGDDLVRLLHPRSIAIIGASSDPMSPSGRPLDFLRQHGWAGSVYPVNPARRAVGGVQAWPSVASVPEVVDVAAVVVAAAKVAGVLEECKAAGVANAVVFSSGFAEAGPEGASLEASVRTLAADGRLRVLGPNCEGLVDVAGRVPLTFSPVLDRQATGHAPLPGRIAVVSQSGGLGFALLDAAVHRDVGLSHVVTCGNEADLDALEIAEALVRDPATDVIMLLVEGLRRKGALADLAADARRRGVHLLVAKLGSTAVGRRSTPHHTGHEAGDAEEYRDLFVRHGLWEADGPDRLLDAATALDLTHPMRGPRVGILSSSGGAGIWLADDCSRRGLSVPELSPVTQRALAALMPSFGSARNPVDITAQAVWEGGFASTLEILLASGEVDGVAIATSLTSARRLEREADALRAVLLAHPMPVMVYSYTAPSASAMRLLADLSIPWYPTPERTAEAFRCLAWAASPLPD